MESLIVFVIIIGINVFSKSVQDKKKIEKAKMKRTEELKKTSSPRPKMAERVDRAERSGRNLTEESNKARDKGQRPQYDYTTTEDRIMEKNIAKKPTTSKSTENPILKEIQEEIKNDLRGGLDNKKLVNAIIWSEILAEPKSVQNIKKGM